jgi:hypothetical protein
MNALKNILFFGLLIAVLCGVYLSLSRQPEQPLPPELAHEVAPLTVEIPSVAGPPGLNMPSAPAAGSTAAVAPPPTPTMREWPSSRGDTAPLFPAAPSVSLPPPPSERQAALTPSTFPSGRGQIGQADNTAVLPPPPTDTLPPGRDPFHSQNYPAGVTNPTGTVASAGTSASADGLVAAGGASAAPPWASQQPQHPPRPEVTNVSNPPPDERARTSSIDTILQQVGLKVNEGKLADALLILSPLYDNPDVPEDKAKKITEILDYMAAKVIYSRESLLERPYGVQASDTLESIADRYKVPALLLARINGMNDMQNLPPGKELKVLKGPFIAKVSTARSEMTMMLDGRYAGRFPITLSSDLQHATGLYHVQAKSSPGANGAAAKPQWIELGNSTGKIGIEATSDMRRPGAIWLSEQDMDDIYGILSVGSVLIIQR